MTHGAVLSSRERDLCFDARESLDRELARAARKSSPLRFAIGVGLERLAVTSGHHELGFATLQAYAAERCGRSGAWVRQARLLARKSAEWPALRGEGPRETLRFRVEPEVRALYRGTETLYLRNRTFPFGFLQFACRVFIETWAREIPPIAYAHIYARDGFKCTNPTCPLYHGAPHHTRFRSQGGTDGPDNVITACPWCHLQGIHENRISVTGKAPHGLTCRIGNHTTVIGRTRIRNAA